MTCVSPSRRRRWTRKHLVWVVGFVGLGLALLLLAGRVGVMTWIDAAILRLREAGPAVFFSAMALLPAVGFPLLTFTVAAGPVFGPTLGAGWVVAWSLVAVIVNLLLVYWLANRALRPLIGRLLASFEYPLPEKPAGGAWQLALLVRLTPGPPFWAQSYLLGVMRVPFVPYLVVSTLVNAGFIVALVYGGDAIAQGNRRQGILAMAVLALSVGALWFWRRRTAQRARVARSATASKAAPTFKVSFDGAQADVFETGCPVLAGEDVERLFCAARPAGKFGAIALFATEDWLVGTATVPLKDGLEEATRRLYADMFAATKSRHLARIWNYVPAINDSGTDGLENYQVFCRGRSLAFEAHHGSGFKTLLPSASAVGTKARELTVSFAACSTPPRHVENPLQVPAYDYPHDYGPRAPCFARATVVPGRESATVFISGTAAIRGHATIAPDHLREQLQCTVENLREISGACGLGADLDREGRSTRHFKVYLRHPADQPAVATALDEALLRDADHVSYLYADICRAPLLVEIEASFFGVCRKAG